MTARVCPACGLEQPLVAPRCARCGAPLDGSRVGMISRPPLGPASDVDDRSVLESRPLGSGPAAPASPGTGRSTLQSDRGWRRLWRRFRARPGGSTPQPPRGEWAQWGSSPEQPTVRDDDPAQ